MLDEERKRATNQMAAENRRIEHAKSMESGLDDLPPPKVSHRSTLSHSVSHRAM